MLGVRRARDRRARRRGGCSLVGRLIGVFAFAIQRRGFFLRSSGGFCCVSSCDSSHSLTVTLGLERSQSSDTAFRRVSTSSSLVDIRQNRNRHKRKASHEQ